MNRLLHLPFTVLLLLVILSITSCKDDEFNEINDTRPEPTISFEPDVTSLETFFGETVSVSAIFEAQSGLDTVQVKRNNIVIENITVTAGTVETTYEITETVDATYTPGDEIKYEFTVTDKSKRKVTGNFVIKIIIPPPPTISFVGNVTGLVIGAGATVDITTRLIALSGLKTLKVSLEGLLISEINLFQKSRDSVVTVPLVIPITSQTGNLHNYSFVLTDKDDRSTSALALTITTGNPAATFTIVPETIEGITIHVIEGLFNINTELVSTNKYLLKGKVSVNSGTTLTIAAGTTIYGDTRPTSLVSALIISQGGKIAANGTQANPIIFTSLKDITATAATGDWVGIHVNGFASASTVSATLSAEIGNYGGSVDVDDSGVLKYVRVEFAGKDLAGSTGALNLNAVGSGTSIDYINIHAPSSNGLRIRGGRARIKHLVVNNPTDQGLRWQDDFSGFLQHAVLFYTSNPASAQTIIEGRTGLATGQAPILSNFTILSVGGATFSNSRGIRIRESGFGKFYNTIVTKTGTGVRVDTELAPSVTAGTIGFFNGRTFDNTANYSNAASVFSGGSFGNSTTPIVLTNNFVGTDAAGAIMPSTLNAWFDAADYIGAVPSSADWTMGWIR